MSCSMPCWKPRRSSGEGSRFLARKTGRNFWKIPGQRVMLDPDLSIAARISRLVEDELAEADRSDDRVTRATARDLRRALKVPREVTVNFSGGITQTCWSVSRGDGTYRVIYMPRAGYFSLCVESDFGPLDIGVHGPALGCFGSV